MNDLQDHPLWQRTEAEFLRAERLLERSVETLQQQTAVHGQERARIALELERAVAPIQALCMGLQAVIEEMANDRQDNRLQQWQARMQSLLLDVDEAERWLQELMLQLEHPTPDQWQGQTLQEARPAIQRYQLQQLLAQRQRRIQELQAEVKALRQQAWEPRPVESAASTGTPEAAVDPEFPKLFS